MQLSEYQSAVLRDSAARVAFLLPHDLRRSFFQRVQPRQRELHDTMRQHDLGVIPGQAVSLTAYDRNECIFVHVPKNGGMSIGRALFGDYEGNHLPIQTYQMVFSKEDFDRYFKFAFVRNPWDRLVSGYRYMRNRRESRRGADLNSIVEPGAEGTTIVRHDTNARVRAELSVFDDFEHFVTRWITPENTRIHEHFRPQHRFVCSPDGQMQLDFLGRFETLDVDFAYVADRLGINSSLIHDNRTNGAEMPYQEMYTPQTRKIVAELYDKDIRLFGYSFDDA